ncbi:MAG: SulP family inorganic anion transporter [Intrasporangium sp.]|uniref:SulP family inorganic anion transporter n=1 Tax=Intrasporangium sp. TaxID=1925024 RepID=UPI003F7EC754
MVRSDLLAGLTVGVVALPLALAFAVSSGVSPAVGLVTAVVAGIVAAVFGGSHVQVSGPTGAMAVVIAPIVATHGTAAVPVVALMAGAIVLVAGIARLGRVVTLIPWPVVEGFTLGIATIIFLQQVPAALDTREAVGGSPVVAAARSVLDHGDAAWWTVACVAAVGAVMLLLPRLVPKAPASLLAVIVVTTAAELLNLPVARIGTLPNSLPLPALPDMSPGLLRALAGPALAVAALAAIESLLSARVAASLPRPTSVLDAQEDPGEARIHRYEPDRELVGQGMASLASGLFGGLPATGAIARTAVSVRAGARTRLAAIAHALVILGVIYLATGPVSRIPMAALAGVLMVTATRMVSLHTLRRVLRSTRTDAAVLVVTAVVTIAVDLIEAVQVGIVVAAFFALRSVARATVVHRERLPGPAQPGDEHIALYTLDGSMFFGAAERIGSEISSDRQATVVVLRLSRLRVVDATGAHALMELVARLEGQGVIVLIKGIQPRHRTLFTNVGVLDELRHDAHLFDELDPALAHAREHVRWAEFGGGRPQGSVISPGGRATPAGAGAAG